MTVLVLGATSPIARAVGARYASEARSIAFAARDVAEAQRIASDVAIRFDVPTMAVRFDALDAPSHAAMIDAVIAELGVIEVAVLAFGAMGDQEISQDDFEAARRVIDTNYTGAVSVCELLAPAMIEAKKGSIVGISSVAGERGRKSNYVYGSAKGAFSLYLGGLRNRLTEHGVRVVTVKLGFVDTRMTFGMQTAIPVASPEDAAAAIVDAEQRGQEVLYYPRFWRPIMGVIRAIPERLFKKLSL